MSDFEPLDFNARRSPADKKPQADDSARETPRSFSSGGGAQAPQVVAFDRRELNQILNLYGRKVAEGEWRDYAIDFLRDRAVFSIFRRTAEVPLYRIEKDPKLARKQGAFSVITATGLILKRGHELDLVIAVLDKKLKVVT